jgi:hypothetical protein
LTFAHEILKRWWAKKDFFCLIVCRLISWFARASPGKRNSLAQGGISFAQN